MSTPTKFGLVFPVALLCASLLPDAFEPRRPEVILVERFDPQEWAAIQAQSESLERLIRERNEACSDSLVFTAERLRQKAKERDGEDYERLC